MASTLKMQRGVLKELKNIRRFFDMMERDVKSGNTMKVSRAYVFIKTLVHHMDKGDLTPFEIELHHALLVSYEEWKAENE